MRRAIAGCLLVLTVALAGTAAGAHSDNGVSSLTATQILAKAREAVAGAQSVNVYGSGTSDGSPIALNLKLVKGQGGAGHLAVGGLAFDIVRVGPSAYFKGAASFWSHFTKSPGLQELFAGKWLRASATKGDLASLTPLTDMVALTNELLKPTGSIRKGPTTVIGGQPAIELIDSDGGILYIATTGPPYPLRVKSGGKDTGKIIFGRWNRSFPLTRPGKSLDFTKLTGG